REVADAVRGNPHFDASRIEIDREGDTFTVDTLRLLRKHYPDNVQFYFMVGSDAAASIGKWRGHEEIAELAHLAVAAGRPGTASSDELRRTILAAAPFDLHLVQASALQVSSSDIRARIAEGRSVRYLVPESVRVSRTGMFAAGTDALHAEVPAPQDAGFENDPLSDAFFEERKAELVKRVSPKRFAHSLGVSETCVQLAERYGVDVRKARIAGLLHDWDKGYDDAGARARVRELGMEDEVDPCIVQDMPTVLHGITAARALGRQFPQIPHDVLQAIDRHTTAALDMSALDMVLYIADAIEPNRQFGRIDELRAAVGSASLEELYYQTYEYWVFLLFERRKPLHPDTIRIWNAHAHAVKAAKAAARDVAKATAEADAPGLPAKPVKHAKRDKSAHGGKGGKSGSGSKPAKHDKGAAKHGRKGKH
ncbi:MAG TPA: hypothetical protein DCP91_06850, partial [Eggerthellaceae bacterium]|nr:hypothetical protein [Eggerthellaceae bacterium]